MELIGNTDYFLIKLVLKNSEGAVGLKIEKYHYVLIKKLMSL